jgi:hypothetical protein
MRWWTTGAVLTAAYLPFLGAVRIWQPEAPLLLEAGVFVLTVLLSTAPAVGITAALGMLGSGIYGLVAEGEAFRFALTLLAVVYPYTAILSARALFRSDDRPPRGLGDDGLAP